MGIKERRLMWVAVVTFGILIGFTFLFIVDIAQESDRIQRREDVTTAVTEVVKPLLNDYKVTLEANDSLKKSNLELKHLVDSLQKK